MKNQILLTAIFSLSILSSFGNLTESEKNKWEKLDWLVRGTTPFGEKNIPAEIKLNLWAKDITISITGDYHKQDSLELDKVITEFNSAIPNRNICWCKEKEASLVIFFTNLNAPSYSQKQFFIDYVSYSPYYGRGYPLILNHKFNIRKIKKATLYIQPQSSTKAHKNLLWQAFGKMMIGNEKGNGFRIRKLSVLGRELNELTEFDSFFFYTVYSWNFKEQYSDYIKSEYNLWEHFIYLTHDEVKTSIVATFQVFLMVILVFLFYVFLWQRRLKHKVKSSFWRFIFTGLILVIPLIISSIIALLLSDYYISYKSPIEFKILITVIQGISSLIFGLIIIMILYIVENFVFKHTSDYVKKQIVRIGSVFFCILISILLAHFLKDYKSITSINNIQVIISFLTLIAIRFVYFHDQHQQAIIKQHQQIKINKLEQLQTKFQLDAIQARTNPHFLYNSLNTIASLAKQDAKKTEDFALKLAKLLRFRLSEDPEKEIPLMEEIETIKLYLEIEKERFGERFNYFIKIQEETQKLHIPSFILLHLIENAIKHGISKNSGDGKIRLVVSMVDDTLLLKVYDNGPDFPKSPVYGTGIKNIIEKLDILYPDNFEFSISNTPSKFVMISLNL